MVIRPGLMRSLSSSDLSSLRTLDPRLADGELQDISILQGDRVASELAHAELRPLQISQTLHLALSLNSANTASLPSQLLRRLPDQRVDPLEVATPAMGAVQTEDVGARLRSRLSRSPRLTWIILGIISSLQDAGPKLATTLVFLNASLVSWRHANAHTRLACFLLPMVTCSIGGTTSPITSRSKHVQAPQGNT